MENTSPRQHLAALLQERAAIEDRSRQLSDQIKNLRDADLARASLQQRLDELNRSETMAMASGDAVLDLEARARLNAELAEATAKAQSAHSAIEVINQSQAILTTKRGEIARKIEMAKAPILIEVAGPLIDEVDVAVRGLRQRMTEALVATDSIGSAARDKLNAPQADVASVQPILLAVERFNEKINNSLADLTTSIRPRQDTRWSDFIAALSHDAFAKLDLSQ